MGSTSIQTNSGMLMNTGPKDVVMHFESSTSSSQRQELIKSRRRKNCVADITGGLLTKWPTSFLIEPNSLLWKLRREASDLSMSLSFLDSKTSMRRLVLSLNGARLTSSSTPLSQYGKESGSITAFIQVSSFTGRL